jgi:hypothetical protein
MLWQRRRLFFVRVQKKEGNPEYKKMKRSGIIMLAVLALSCLCGYRAYAGARPVVDGLLSLQFFDAKTSVGNDGMLRLLFDYSPAPAGSPSTYSGSALWIINPNGSVVAAGSPTIPASIGSDIYAAALLNTPTFISPFERSNTAIFAQADGNTTVLFYYNARNAGLGFTNSFAVWTYNSSGALIAAASYGPFSGVRLAGLYFEASGKTVARWKPEGTFTANAGWVLDEFGTILNSTAFFGPFGTTFLGKIKVNSSNQQIWPFRFLNKSTGQYTTTMWTFDSSGSLTNAQVFGPF